MSSYTPSSPSAANRRAKSKANRRGPVAVIWLFRLLVGGLFVFSGFVKINDVHGFAIKLDKYWYAFEEAIGMGLSALTSLSMSLAATVSAFEVLLGVLLLFGISRRFTTTMVFLMIIFFTFLTGWAAITKSVPDCGCFGDFLTIEPWMSFTKDLVLLVMTGLLFLYRDQVTPLVPSSIANGIISGVATIGIVGFTYYTMVYEPVLDFRACKVGNDFRVQVTFDPQTGQEPLHGYVPIGQTCNGQNEMEGATMLVFIKDMTAVSAPDLQATAALARSLEGQVKVYGLTSTPQAQRQPIAQQFGLTFCITDQDQDLLKTCIRNYPGFLLLKNGIIVGKWNINSIPSKDEVMAALQ
jgi:uncharacterized membrane protein YphA (DoxX/SURF4 family)